MEIESTILDIAKYEEMKLQPAAIVSRDGHMWLTRDVPLDCTLDKDSKLSEWGWCSEGDLVRIGLWPYCAKASAVCIALGYAFELGIKARDFVSSKYDIKKLNIFVGNEVKETNIEGNPVLRFWLGYGFALSERT